MLVTISVVVVVASAPRRRGAWRPRGGNARSSCCCLAAAPRVYCCQPQPRGHGRAFCSGQKLPFGPLLTFRGAGRGGVALNKSYWLGGGARASVAPLGNGSAAACSMGREAPLDGNGGVSWRRVMPGAMSAAVAVGGAPRRRGAWRPRGGNARSRRRGAGARWLLLQLPFHATKSLAPPPSVGRFRISLARWKALNALFPTMLWL